jgi:hypothetical protein
LKTPRLRDKLNCVDTKIEPFTLLVAAQKRGREIMSEKTKNVVSLTLGIIGVVIGVLALLSGWIPYLGLVAIPIAIIGFLLSGMGVGFACFKKFKSIELPILGCLLCIIAISLSIFTTYQAHAAIARQQAALAQEQREKAEAEEKAKAKAAMEARRNQIASLETEIATLQINVTNEEQNVEEAQKQVDQAKVKYDQFMAAQPLLTNAVYLKIKKDIPFRTGLIASQQQTRKFLEEEVNKPYSPQTWVEDYHGVNGTSGHWVGSTPAEWAEQKQVIGNRLADAENNLANAHAQINADQQALEKMENDVDEFQANKVHDAESLLNAAKSHLTETQSSLAAAKSHLETIKN